MSGQHSTLQKVLAAFLGGGHVLLEDNPRYRQTQTTLAKALARSVDAEFKRVQFTPDLLAPDILASRYSTPGSYVPVPRRAIFTRSCCRRSEPRETRARSRRSRSDGGRPGQHRRQDPALDEMFFVIATQNPVEFRGTTRCPRHNGSLRAASCAGLRQRGNRSRDPLRPGKAASAGDHRGLYRRGGYGTGSGAR